MSSKPLPPSWRRLTVATAVALALPAVSHALGLGRPIGEPVLGEALLIELPVTGSMDRSLDAECITVRRSPESIDAEYFPRDIVARVDRQAGATRLVLSTRSAIRQPLVEFRVSITCGYNLSHDYLLMASPRREAVSQPTAAVAQKVDAPAVAPSVGGSVQQAGAIAPAPAQVPDGVGLPDGLAGKSIVLDKNMTLEQLARKHFPGPLRQGRFMRWVAEANPHLFAGSKQLRQHQLQSGQQLVIPDGVPPRRPGDYKNGLTPLGEPMTPPQTAAADAPARKNARQPADGPEPIRSAPDGGKDRLVVGGAGGTSRDAKETIALVERLTGMMEQQLATQAANDEKIKQLEATVADLGKVIARMEREATEREARWQAERQAEKSAREQETERGWWQLLMAVAVGGILGAAVLQGFRLLAGRKQGATSAVDAFPPFASEKKATTEPDDGSRPLTEFGWDDENGQRAASRQAAAEARPAPIVASRVEPSQPATSATPTPPSGKAPETPSAISGSGLEAPRGRAAEPVANIEFEPPTPETTAQREPIPSNPAEAAIELANIMTSMGLAQSAAQTLVEHIRENPRQSLAQWLKLLEIHRLNGNRADFEKYSHEMRQHFNVQPDDWTASSDKSRASLEDFPHIRSQIIRLWRKPELTPLLQALLLDNREGTRAGFPLPVAEEILLLMAMTNSSNG